jgi:UDP-sulfoquinovose synthase
MKVLVLGGDGFCGWPTSLHLSDRGHDVTILDNLSRRNIDNELQVESLTPIRPIGERLQVWSEVSGREMSFINLDIAKEFDRLVDVLISLRPDAIVHFAEQRAAPYSMRSSKTKRYTVDNNVTGTHNLLAAVVESGLSPRHDGRLLLRMVGLCSDPRGVLDGQGADARWRHRA